MIHDRYASSVRSRDLTSHEKTVRSDSDVLGAMGLADRTLTKGHDGRGRPVYPCELAVPLARLLAGDNHAVHQVVGIMGAMAHAHSFEIKLRISRSECEDMARATIAWFRHGACTQCGGRGHQVIPGTKTLSDRDCDACYGTGKRQFLKEFFPDRARMHLAAWLACELDRALGRAGPQAMAHLAPRLFLDDFDED